MTSPPQEPDHAAMKAPFRIAILACVGVLFGAPIPPTVAEPTYAVDAQDRDLADFLRQVSDITGKTIILTPQVTGRVNLIVTKKMTANEVWELTQSVLAVNGYTAVTQGNIVTIVPATQAATSGGPVVVGPATSDDDGVATLIIDLTHAAPESVAAALQPLLGENGRASAAPGRRAVVLVDTTANLARLRGVIRQLDQPDGDREVVVVPLTYAEASAVAGIMTLLFAESGGVDGKGCPCRFIAVERSNTVVIRVPGPNIRAAKKLARRLDRSDAEVEIARLKAMDAEQARKLLQSLAR
ncbi:MAG: hypothetical protein H6685_10945 [Deltaproteobacteria bacterium]|nr:hypothetical protein [Deltaproteobacteria bacterium]